jgi:hypothetical protein
MNQFFAALGVSVLFSTLFVFYSFAPKEVCPVVHINGKVAGDFSAKAFSKIETLSIKDGDKDCNITSYLMYYIRPGKDAMEFKGNNALLKGLIKSAAETAEQGHKYIFAEVKLQCKGDEAPQEVNNLSFTIR